MKATIPLYNYYLLEDFEKYCSENGLDFKVIENTLK